MKKMIKQITAAALLAASLVAPALAEVKIAVVDMEGLLNTSKYAQNMGKQLRDEFSARQKSIADLQQSVQAQAQDLKKKSTTLSAKDLAALKDKLNKDALSLQQQQQQFFQDLNTARNKSMEQFYNKLQGVTGDIAKKDGYTLVLPKRLTLYADSSTDITNQVKDQLN